MSATKKITKSLLSIAVLLLLLTPRMYSQEYILNNETSQVIVSGTSSLHDWHVDAEQQKGKILLDMKSGLKILKLTIDVTAESLKSGKNGMDKNTYKALNTKQHKYIKFELSEMKEATSEDNGNYNVKASGNLTVAGVVKKINLDFNLQVASNKVTLKGEKSFKMTDFGIEPPKALLGTITTGDEITIKFNTVLIN